MREGDAITHHYDPLIAKVIVHAHDRPAAIAKMLATLETVAIEGVETNLAFLRKALAHAAFGSGRVRTNLVEAHRAELL